MEGPGRFTQQCSKRSSESERKGKDKLWLPDNFHQINAHLQSSRQPLGLAVQLGLLKIQGINNEPRRHSRARRITDSLIKSSSQGALVALHSRDHEQPRARAKRPRSRSSTQRRSAESWLEPQISSWPKRHRAQHNTTLEETYQWSQPRLLPHHWAQRQSRDSSCLRTAINLTSPAFNQGLCSSRFAATSSKYQGKLASGCYLKQSNIHTSLDTKVALELWRFLFRYPTPRLGNYKALTSVSIRAPSNGLTWRSWSIVVPAGPSTEPPKFRLATTPGCMSCGATNREARLPPR
ncbi:hypothetical protein VTJ04DRAFT_5989 [Mycothermus thermophilus]|uniref:uncharacterized protein n=1 Tax=Humicola insolens TaxID=85995 RepID=UPI0037439FDF